jgi:serine/threonine protein kinase
MGNQISKDDCKKHYDIKEKLGSGTFATVKRAVKKNSGGKEFAIKIIKKDKLNSEELEIVQDEVKIMHKIEHPNCVQLFEMFETKKKLYMVLELLGGGELFDRIVAKGNFSEKEASDLMRDVTSCIKYLHEIGVVHRDLKPENLIYATIKENSPIKITDFGLAKFCKKRRMDTPCGTPGYVAPEVLKNESYGAEVDMWSIGVILYILLCGFPPFYHDSTTELYKQIKNADYSFPSPYWDEISEAAKDLVSCLLEIDPKKRYTPAQVLEHRWISGKAASTRKFGAEHNQRVRILQARRMLRRGVRSIIAVNRFGRQLRRVLDK